MSLAVNESTDKTDKAKVRVRGIIIVKFLRGALVLDSHQLFLITSVNWTRLLPRVSLLWF